MEHLIENSIVLYLESLPGFENSLHAEATLKKYKNSLMTNNTGYSFLLYMKNKGRNTIEQLKIEDIEQYKDYLLNHWDSNSVRGHLTAVRGLLNYVTRMGWLQENIGKLLHLPKPKKPSPAKSIPSEVITAVLTGNWGINSFTAARNRLIACLILKRGLMPNEFATIQEEHIKPYKNYAYITVLGKGKKSRNVFLDMESMEALRVYMIERSHYMLTKKIHEKSVFLSLIPRGDSYAITGSGIQAVLRNIRQELRLRGYIFDLSGLTSQNCRRVVRVKEYKQTNRALIPHVDLTLSGQHGYSTGRIPVYNKKTTEWTNSFSNSHEIISHIRGKRDPAEQERVESLQKIYPESSFFRNFGVSLPAVFGGSTEKRIKGEKSGRPDRDLLRAQLNDMGYTDVAKLYGTSRNTIRKWAGNYIIRSSNATL